MTKLRSVRPLLVAGLLLVACGTTTITVGGNSDGGLGGSGGSGGQGGQGGGGSTLDGGSCPALPAAPSDGGVAFAPAFGSLYSVYELGPPPGVPGPLGGCVILSSDRSTLWIAGASESTGGGLYRIKIRRDACNHLVGYDGAATKVATTPYIDANLLEVAGGSILYTGWPVYELSQIRVGATAPLYTLDLRTRGQTGSSAGGLGVVPRALAGGGGLRMVGWPDGQWHALNHSIDAGVYSVASVAPVPGVVLPNGPGGFAYVPSGSPGFPIQSVIVAEWSVDRVGVYEVNGQGNPLPATRRDFFTRFPKPWGAYFEPETGDYLFLTWLGGGVATDSVFVVQGFAKPPEIN